jgi:molybdopterin converting factor small subunit
MIVTVKLMSDLRRYLRGRAEPLHWDLPEGAAVADLARALGIPPEEEMIVGVNGLLGYPDTPLSDGDEVMLLTPMSGG